ncbi:MAG TPA: cytidine deaminase [Syntrophomonadaceae bacterium]|nr:cytidine deaminase [Syntrophomonadaceae bacterium]
MKNIPNLIKKAREAELCAYSPYSKFSVGAALLTKEGNIFTGSNVENSSFGLTVCAERIAVFKAVTSGEKEFDTILISASGLGYPYPCGACLQVLAEFSPEMTIIVIDEQEKIRKFRLKEMLPQIFLLNQQEGDIV